MKKTIDRRSFLKWGAITGVGLAFEGSFMRHLTYGALPQPTGCTLPSQEEPNPTSPFILHPFRDRLPIPKALKRGWLPNPERPGEANWTVRRARRLGPDTEAGIAGPGVVPPGPHKNQQDSYGHRLAGETLPDGQTVPVEHAGTHQVWPSPRGQNFDRLINWQPVEPIRYHIRLQVAAHSFTTSKVMPIDALGNPVTPPPGVTAEHNLKGEYILPPSTIYGFNGTFPGPMINAEYGKPVVVRFENDLDQNPLNLDRGDFGAPDFAFLTHLHNGHTAPESDGQPHYMQINEGGYIPGDWCDNLYLNYPAGGDPAEMMSFLWFHDHRMHHTGANVYKGMVGLFPLYDPGIPDGNDGIVPGTGLDTGNESDPAPNLKLPGVRVNLAGRFNVKYDIPMAFYDVALNDGVTPHADQHIDLPVCGDTHPEQWGQSFFKHYPGSGFVGDIFTVNGVAFPKLVVLKRRYRFRFLDASVARCYELCLMTSQAGPQPFPGTQGQWQIPDGQLWRPFTQIASMGGLLPTPLIRNSIQIWPATRNEHVIDFTDVPAGTVIYLTNIMEMSTGLKPDNEPGLTPFETNYKVPLVKIVVSGRALPEPDESVMPQPGDVLRPMPFVAGTNELPNAANTAGLPTRHFLLTKGGPDPEDRWVINDLPFDPLIPMATFTRDQPVLWTNQNGGGGWVHPMHMHQEEHTVITRDGKNDHIDDSGKSDVTNLDKGESVTIYRNFRTFTGRYVAHCHNLAHEDHNMMFGWEIVDPV